MKLTFDTEKEIRKVEIAGRWLEFEQVSESPCRRACPAGIDVKKYVGQIAGEDFDGALATIRRHMPFPSACGRICLHPCETECKRAEVDEPIQIMHLKRFAHEYESREGLKAPLPEKHRPTGKKVAIIGSGPAGLTAAHDLAIMGHDVVVFEKMQEPGGNLRYAIPEFELPLGSVRNDIGRIENLGVRIRCGHAIQGEAGLKELLKEGYDAVLVATGVSARWKGVDGTRWLPGGTLAGVIGASKFAANHRSGDNPDLASDLGNVVVIGYGVHALGAAKVAIRLGVPSVTWIIPVETKQLQPDPSRVQQAIDEGIRILECSRPVEIVGSGNAVSGVKIIKLGEEKTDHTGRVVRHPVAGSEEIIDCDSVIDAAWFVPDTKWNHLAEGPWGNIKVNRDTMATSVPGIFAAGDVVSGPKSVVEAVSLGHRAASGINNYLFGRMEKLGTLSTPVDVCGWEVSDPGRNPSPAIRPKIRPVDERLTDFRESVEVMTVWEATHEAGRCLLCGPCSECAVCLSTCYRKKGKAESEDGGEFQIRIPTEIAKAIREKTLAGHPELVNLFAAEVAPELCRGCGVCEEICGYHAPRIAPDPVYGLVSQIDILACKGCGTCIAACPSTAIEQGVTSINAMREAIRGRK